MYVCVCKRVSDTALERCLDGGATDLDAVQQQTGLGTVCGKCKFRAHRMLNEYMENARARQAVELKFRAG